MVNDNPTEKFILKRGLHKGDPLSHLPLLLAGEGLNVMMEATIEMGNFPGYIITPSGNISTSHLQFADNTLLVG